MSHEEASDAARPPFAGTPTWLRVVQAAVVGLVAGLVLSALLSLATLHGQGRGMDAPEECKRTLPTSDTVAPAPKAPAISWMWLSLEDAPPLG